GEQVERDEAFPRGEVVGARGEGAADHGRAIFGGGDRGLGDDRRKRIERRGRVGDALRREAEGLAQGEAGGAGGGFGVDAHGAFFAQIGLGLQEERGRENTAVHEDLGGFDEALGGALDVALHGEGVVGGAAGPVVGGGEERLRGERVLVEELGDFHIAAGGGLGGAGAVVAQTAEQRDEYLEVDRGGAAVEGRGGRRDLVEDGDLGVGPQDDAVAQSAGEAEGVGELVGAVDGGERGRPERGGAVAEGVDVDEGVPVEGAGRLLKQAGALLYHGGIDAQGGVFPEGGGERVAQGDGVGFDGGGLRGERGTKQEEEGAREHGQGGRSRAEGPGES